MVFPTAPNANAPGPVPVGETSDDASPWREGSLPRSRPTGRPSRPSRPSRQSSGGGRPSYPLGYLPPARPDPPKKFAPSCPAHARALQMDDSGANFDF